MWLPPSAVTVLGHSPPGTPALQFALAKPSALLHTPACKLIRTHSAWRACSAQPRAACMPTRPCALCAVLHKLLAVLLWACGQHYRAALPAVSMWPAFSRAARPGASACTPCLSRARRRRQRRWDGVRSWRTGALVVRRPVLTKRVHPAPKGAPGCAPMRGPPRCPANPPGPVLDPSENSGTPGGSTTARDPPLTFQPPGIHR